MIAGERRVLLPRRCVATPPAAGAHAAVQSLGGATMGTAWRVMLVEPAQIDLGTLRQDIEALFDAIIAAMSTWEETSEICRFNRAPAGRAHTLSPDFFTVLDKALQIAAETDGWFDPTLGNSVCAWGFGPPDASCPGTIAYDRRDARPTLSAGVAERVAREARRVRCRSRCLPCHPPPHPAPLRPLARKGNARNTWRARWQDLVLERPSRAVRQPGGIGLDLSAIAKGYAVDRLAALLRAAGIASFLAEIGGELVGRGTKPNGEPWWVLLETPPGDTRRIVPTVLALNGLAVASSGDYRRYRDVAGRRLCHLIDPRTREPAAGAVAAVSVVHETCMEADALATALAVMNAERAFDFAERRRLAARFVLRCADGLEERLSTAMQQMTE
jgi:thiamine biosynthesis lipoprotein